LWNVGRSRRALARSAQFAGFPLKKTPQLTAIRQYAFATALCMASATLMHPHMLMQTCILDRFSFSLPRRWFPSFSAGLLVRRWSPDHAAGATAGLPNVEETQLQTNHSNWKLTAAEGRVATGIENFAAAD